MDQQSLILYAIIAAVLIGIPVMLARKTGRKPMELLFGKRENRSFFGSKKKDSEGSRPAARKQTNSNKNDFLDLLSRLTTYARRNHFRLIIPGTLSCGETVAVLTALIITRSKVVGINCFGFGGRVVAAEGEEDWEQIMNGVHSPVPSPVKKNRVQEKIVRQALEEEGFADADVEIVGVFTSPSVWLSNASGTNCYKKDEALKVLKTESFLKDGGLDPAEIEAALEKRIVRAKGKKEEKQEESKP